MASAACIFCRMVKGEIPCFKIFEGPRVLAFMDIGPLSRGHALVIPKTHGEKLTDIPDEDLAELLPAAKKVAAAVTAATKIEAFNILQNNGRVAHQFVGHIPKHNPDRAEETEEGDPGKGLGIEWPEMRPKPSEDKQAMAELAQRCEAIKSHM